MAPTNAPKVDPEPSFTPISLNSSALPSGTQKTLYDPLVRFVIDRFKTMTTTQAADFLARVDLHMLQTGVGESGLWPSQIAIMKGALGLQSESQITLEVAKGFYSEYCPFDQFNFVERLLQDERTRQITTEQTFDFLATQLPAIGYTLAHVFEGGYIGLLTARGDRAEHEGQIARINHTLGFGPQLELIYYVNDAELSTRLGPTGRLSADKKALVLMNFINGLKEDESGKWVPMKLGKPFDEIIFIDDEDKNLKAVMECLIRDVCSNVLLKIGIEHRTPYLEQRLTDCTREIMEKEFASSGVESLQRFDFWLGVVDALLGDYTSPDGQPSNRETLITSLMQDSKWLPDKLKVFDGRKPFQTTRARLEAVFTKGQPVTIGSKRSIVFNDIDGNLLTVPAKFVFYRKGAPENSLLEITQAQFAEDPALPNWKAKVAEQTGLPAEEIQLSMAHFTDRQTIDLDILKAAYRGDITKAPEFQNG